MLDVFDAVAAPYELEELLLALSEREAAEIPAVKFEQIERAEPRFVIVRAAPELVEALLRAGEAQTVPRRSACSGWRSRCAAWSGA